MSTPRSVALVLVAIGALASGCTGTQSSASAPGRPPPTIPLTPDLAPGVVTASAEVRAIGAEQVDTIVMIGDSITVASTPALESEFASLGFDAPVIVSQERKRMAVDLRDNPGGAAIAEFLVAAGEDGEDGDAGGDPAEQLWIVALGTNDINQYDGPDEVGAAIDDVLAAVPERSPLVWVDTYYRDHPDGAAMVNLVIADRLERRGNAVIAPWSHAAGADGTLRADGVHPSSTGREVFAAVVAETAAGFLGR